MGLRLLLGITLLSLAVTLASVAYGGRTWEVTGRTDEGGKIWFGFGPDAFEVDVMTSCGRVETGSQGEVILPFVGQHDRLRADQRVPGVIDGHDYTGRWRLEAVVTGDAIAGRVRLDQRWVRGRRQT